MSFVTLSRSELDYIRVQLDACGGTLDHDEFVATLQHVLGTERADERELSVLFMQIDANSGGDVDWEELTSNFLLKSELDEHHQEAAHDLAVFTPTHLSRRTQTVIPRCIRHRGNVSHIVWYRRGKLLITAAQDGMAKAWNVQTLQHQRVSLALCSRRAQRQARRAQ